MCKAGLARMRKIWLTRHGESMYNTLARLGGDSPLSPRGEVYSKKLPDVLVDRVPLVGASDPRADSGLCPEARGPVLAHIAAVWVNVRPLLRCQHVSLFDPTRCTRIELDLRSDPRSQTSDGSTMPVSVWTSTLRRTIQTAESVPFPKLRWKVSDSALSLVF